MKRRVVSIFLIALTALFSISMSYRILGKSDIKKSHTGIETDAAAGPRFEVAPVVSYPVQERDSVEVIILMYHTINDVSRSAWSITPEDFENDLIYLQQGGYCTVTISDLIAYENGTGTLPEKPVALTFDDGYASNLLVALPLLEKYDACATINVIGSYVSEPIEGVTPTDDMYFDWNQMQELEASGRIEIGHHTWDMHKYDENERIGCAITVGEDEASYIETLTTDLNTFQTALLEHGLSKASCFAYPHGKNCVQSDKLITQLGFGASLLSVEGLNTITRFDATSLFGLKRYNRPPDLSLETIFARAGY